MYGFQCTLLEKENSLWFVSGYNNSLPSIMLLDFQHRAQQKDLPNDSTTTGHLIVRFAPICCTICLDLQI